MGMFTKLFSKSHDPYEMKGRWYKISVTPSETGYEFINTDIPVVDPSTYPNIPFGLVLNPSQPGVIGLVKGIILDMKVIPLNFVLSSSDRVFKVDMKDSPFPMSSFGVTSINYGNICDFYIYVVKCNTLPDV